jgi:hypothetical protein
MIEVAEAAEAIVVLHDADGGATFSLHHGNLVGQKLFALSIYPERSEQFIGRSIPRDLLVAFVGRNLDLLADPRVSVGTWSNDEDGHTYLDIVVAVPSRQRAIALAKRYNQVGAYDLERRSFIKTGGTGLPAAGVPPERDRLPPPREGAGPSGGGR